MRPTIPTPFTRWYVFNGAQRIHGRDGRWGKRGYSGRYRASQLETRSSRGRPRYADPYQGIWSEPQRESLYAGLWTDFTRGDGQ